MAKKPFPIRSRDSSDSKSIFMRERLILNVANLRYELEVLRSRLVNGLCDTFFRAPQWSRVRSGR